MGTLRGKRERGQGLVEFALVVPVLFLLLSGIIQFGVLIATKHQLTQVGRDVGRWAATQQATPCTSALPDLRAEADYLALQARLFGYTAGAFTSGGVTAAWSIDQGQCPPADSTDVAWIEVRLSHTVSPVMPGFPDFTLTTTSQFRMEPPPAP
jgi:Flp pilus assembly protein TadG